MDEETRAEIEHLAELQFSAQEIATITGCDFIRVMDSEEYQRGRLRAEAEIRSTIYTMAKKGSTPAQRQMMQLIEKNRCNEAAEKHRRENQE